MTFIQTEEDFAKIAGAGLNWVRLPIPFWAVSTFEDEPYYAKVSWKCACDGVAPPVFSPFDINYQLQTSSKPSNGLANMGFVRAYASRFV